MKTKYFAMACIAVGTLLALGLKSCISIPKGAQAVSPFNSKKYLGKWYEIARLDFKYERGLDHVTAFYSQKPNGNISVENKGYNARENKWKTSIGKAKLVGNGDIGRLKVSFFGPFYAGYNIIAIDTAYQHALVAGNNLNYLWILSREKTIPQDIKTKYLKIAEDIGYNTGKLIWTDQR